MNSDKKDKGVIHFQNLEKKYLAQRTISKLFLAASKQHDKLGALYHISLLIAKTGKPQAIGKDLILPAVKEIITTVLYKPAVVLCKDELLRGLRTDSFQFSGISPLYQLMKHCFCHTGGLSKMKKYVKNYYTNYTDTKGETILNTLEKFCDEKEIPLNNIMPAATDGAPAIIEIHKGFIAYLKNKVSAVLDIPSFMNLVGKI